MQQFLETREAIAAVFAAGLPLSYLWCRVLEVWEGKNTSVAESTFTAQVKRMQLVESDLLKVRRSKTYLPNIEESWQGWAIELNTFEFELFLVNNVWASEGPRLREYRLKISPCKDLIKQIEQR